MSGGICALVGESGTVGGNVVERNEDNRLSYLECFGPRKCFGNHKKFSQETNEITYAYVNLVCFARRHHARPPAGSFSQDPPD